MNLLTMGNKCGAEQCFCFSIKKPLVVVVTGSREKMALKRSLLASSRRMAVSQGEEEKQRLR